MSPPGERRVPVPDREPLTWGRRSGGPDLSTRGPIVRSAIIFYLAMGAAGVIWIEAAGSGIGWGERLLGPRPELALALGVSGGLLLVALTRLLERWEPVARLLGGFAELLEGITPGAALLLAIASAIGEEILFRGALQPAVGPWLAAAIFGAAHLPLDRSFAAWPLFAAVAGLGLGFAAEASGSLLAPIVAHFVVNWLNLRHIARGPA
jgi:membrane protease YdiL (CAAX protease family)